MRKINFILVQWFIFSCFFLSGCVAKETDKNKKLTDRIDDIIFQEDRINKDIYINAFFETTTYRIAQIYEDAYAKLRGKEYINEQLKEYVENLSAPAKQNPEVQTSLSDISDDSKKGEKSSVFVEMVDMDKASKTPAYLTYNNFLLERIKSGLYNTFSHINENGLVCLRFSLSSDGSLIEYRIIDERSNAAEGLKSLAIDALKSSSFAPLPNSREATFTIIIKFVKSEAVDYINKYINEVVESFNSHSTLEAEYHPDWGYQEFGRLIFRIVLHNLSSNQPFIADINERTFLKDDKGNIYRPEQTDGPYIKHKPEFDRLVDKDSYTVRFPAKHQGKPIINKDTKYLKIIIRGLNNVEEREIVWKLPFNYPKEDLSRKFNIN